MENFFESLREHAKKKKKKEFNNKRTRNHMKMQNLLYLLKNDNKYAKDKKGCKVRDHSHYLTIQVNIEVLEIVYIVYLKKFA